MDPLAFDLTGQQIRDFRQTLLEWYRNHRRLLPWREGVTPYRVWISEIMLQQTRVETVIPYFERFMEEFPDVRTLARADLQQVLKVWEGLGYYSRARNLHRAAQLIVEHYGGEFPTDYQQILALPGIGRYTAGAICSIAFGQPYPVVDGNVIRVLARYLDITVIPEKKGKTLFWALAEILLDHNRPGEYNQALMELGATICTPREPNCAGCMLRSDCKAWQNGTQLQRPLRKRKPPVPHFTIAVGIVWRRGQVLIARRPENGLLGGLWEFPGGKLEEGETLEQCVQREILEELGIAVSVKGKITVVRHAYSHFRITLHAFECQYLSGNPRCRACSEFRWVPVSQLHHFPFPRANQKVIERLCAPAPKG